MTGEAWRRHLETYLGSFAGGAKYYVKRFAVPDGRRLASGIPRSG